MYPALFNGDRVHLKGPSKKPSDYTSKDILYVLQDGKLVLHRFVRAKDDLVVTKGDNLTGEDLFPGLVLGEVYKTQWTLRSLTSRVRYFLLRKFSFLKVAVQRDQQKNR